MGRGKIEIKRIENTTNRQVTFSKRRGGLLKKARELSVLCSAEVAVIIFSSTGKVCTHPESTSKVQKILQRYQAVSGKILEEYHDNYQNVPMEIRRLQTELQRLNMAVRQMMGEDLNWLSSNDLRVLEEHLDTAISRVRRKRDEVQQQEREDERNSAKREMAEEQERTRKREEHFQKRIADLEQYVLDNRCAPGLGDFLKDKALESDRFNLIPPTSSIRVQQTQTNLSETHFPEPEPELRLGFGDSHQSS